MTGARSGTRVMVAGSANVDFVVRAPHIPAPGETVLGGDLLVVPGGKGANQAMACARAGGAQTTFLAALGDDAFAGIVEASLLKAGVSVQAVRSARSTGAALITVSDDAENAITVAPGANASLKPSDLPDLGDTRVLVLQLETPIETVTAFAQAGRAAGVTVLLNAAPARSLPVSLLRSVDVLVVNEAELAAIAGGTGTIAEQLAATGVACVIATLGSRGCCALTQGQYIFQPAFLVDPCDTTAAGDTFVGVLAAALACGRSLADGLADASAAAALSTTRHGAQSSIPEMAEVAAFRLQATGGNSADLASYCGLEAASRDIELNA
ncbi:ribokinase [Sphingopyxis sp. FD7]|uniref:ribokinase n=1 Tax=Sphingopyxis sp. FD7 TaxID=1914525 RepID=UPI000DC63C5C|nr:ribokinase [Sphingopyxis sp. FD7]BBB14543.1 ribokinase [Sphingopyxis sp. FD7]